MYIENWAIDLVIWIAVIQSAIGIYLAVSNYYIWKLYQKELDK